MAEAWQSRNGCSDENAKLLIAQLAAKQFGRIRHDQLAVSRTTIARWIAGGYLQRVMPRVYAVGHAAPSTEADLAAALLYAGPGATLSHGTAAWWWGLINFPPRSIHVSTPRRRNSLPGVHVHSRRELDRITRRGLAVTTVAQTLLDFSRDRPDLVDLALANADFHDLLDLGAVDAVCGQGVNGSTTLRDALVTYRPELAQARNEFERLLVRLCDTHSLPLPRLNVYRANWLVDAVWDQQRLVVELDGLRGHRTRAQLESDHQRDLELRLAGYVVLRYTWRQLTRTPDEVADDLRRFL